MCGIAGFHIKNPEVVKDHGGIEKLVDKLLLGIEPRGKHATGFVAVARNGTVRVDKDALTAAEFIKDRERIPEGVQTVLLHTRYATKGPVETPGNNHPVISGTCFAVHNGMISNDDDLFKEKKLERNYEVDTEIISAMLYKSGIKDVKKIKAVLEQLRGPMAIAVIDPIKSPKKLLLAKGDHSPLVVYESDNFIMWASLATAMREAWKEVLGTPPNFDKFVSFKEGEFLIVDDAETTRGIFEVPRPFNSRFGQGYRHVAPWESAHHQNRRNGLTRTPTRTSGSHTGSGSWDTNKSPFPTEAAHKAAVAAWRKEKTSAARLWSKREDYTDDWFDDVPDGESVTWIPCKCGEAVLSQDMRSHIKYGYVCVDCYAVVRNEYMKKVNSGNGSAPEDLRSGSTGRGSEDEPKIRQIPKKDKENLENWAAVDAEAHKLILKAVAEVSGYTEEAINFLIFHIGRAVEDYGVATRDLKTDLEQAYEDLTQPVWVEHGDKLLARLSADEIEYNNSREQLYIPYQVKKGEGVSESWFSCIQHGESFRLGDECESCKHQEEIAHQITGGTRVNAPKTLCDGCGIGFPRYQLTYKEPENYYLCEECAPQYEEGCGVRAFASDGSDEEIREVIESKVVWPSQIKKPYDLLRCDVCKTFVSKGVPCKVCFVNGIETCEPDDIKENCPGCHLCGHRIPTAELSSVDTKKLTHCNGIHTKGQCRKKVQWCVGEQWGYCDKHFGICNKHRCTQRANHILVDGQRVCHGHSRKQEGALADTALLRKGYIITEVKK